MTQQLECEIMHQQADGTVEIWDVRVQLENREDLFKELMRYHGFNPACMKLVRCTMMEEAK